MSSISWVAFSEGERKRTMDVLQLFSESGTLDELGIGRIRDAFSDQLFPGTSTIQTRARYFLLVPWAYRDLELSAPLADPSRRARRSEVQLIEALRQSEAGGTGDTEGFLGRVAGADLVQLPSRIYWQGLLRWGIRSNHGMQAQYHRSLSSRKFRHVQAVDEDFDPMDEQSWWDSELPGESIDSRGNATLALSDEEARYLLERITTKLPDSLLAGLVSSSQSLPTCDYPWQLSGENPGDTLAGVSPQSLDILRHAEMFSLAINGARILFELLMAEEKPDGEEWVEQYRNKLAGWAVSIRERRPELQAWFGDFDSEHGFWATAGRENPSIPREPERRFIEAWIDLALSDPKDIVENARAREMIRQREAQLKGPRAKLGNQSAIAAWKGGTGASALDFRWRTVRTLINDVHVGLGINSTVAGRSNA